MRVDTARNIIFVRGAVPGSDDGFVKIRDALKRSSPVPVPVPTFVQNPEEPLGLRMIAPSKVDPLAKYFTSGA